MSPNATSCQRWKDRRAIYRPAGELFDPRRAEVHTIDEATAKAFVIGNHYSASYPAARYRAGLFVDDALAGVAVFSVPMNQRTVPHYFAGLEPNDGVELGRLVLLDEVPANGESWFVARAFKLLRGTLDVSGVVSYSDPIERTDASGRRVKPGHVGTVYQALNATYCGRSSPRSLLVSRCGRVVSQRALSKLRADDRGAAYAYAQLRDLGAPPRHALESSSEYVKRALRDGQFRTVRHPGNHAYVWWINNKRRAPIFAGKPYPK